MLNISLLKIQFIASGQGGLRMAFFSQDAQTLSPFPFLIITQHMTVHSIKINV